MGSLPDVSLGGSVVNDTDAVDASQVPGVHVSDDAPTVPVTAGGDLPASDLVLSDPEQGDLDASEGDLPGSDLDGDLMSPVGRGLVLARHWMAQAAEGAREVTHTPGGILAIKPQSFAEYRTYVRSRAWVPDGVEGGPVVWVPVAYYNTVGNVLVLAGGAVIWLAGRFLHFAVAVLVAVTATILWLIFS